MNPRDPKQRSGGPPRPPAAPERPGPAAGSPRGTGVYDDPRRSPAQTVSYDRDRVASATGSPRAVARRPNPTGPNGPSGPDARTDRPGTARPARPGAAEAPVRPGTVGFRKRDRPVRRWLVRLGLAALTLVALATIAFVALLHVARLEVLERLQELGRRTGRTVVVGDVRLGLEGTIVLSGLKVSEPGDPGTLALGADRLTARFDVSAVLQGSRRPESVVLRGLWAELHVRGGRLAELDELREALGRRAAGDGPARKLPRVELEDATVAFTVHGTPPVQDGFRLPLEHLTGTVEPTGEAPRAVTLALQGSTPGVARRVSFRVSGDVRGGDDPAADVRLDLDAPFELPPLRGADGPRVRVGGLVLRSGRHVGVTGLEVLVPGKGALLRALAVEELSVDLRGGLVPRPDDIRAITAKDLEASWGARSARVAALSLELGEATAAAPGATLPGGPPAPPPPASATALAEPGGTARMVASLLGRATALRVEQAEGRGDGARVEARTATLTLRPGAGDPASLAARIEHAAMTDLRAEAPGGLPRLTAASLDVRLAGLTLANPLSSVRRLRVAGARLDLEQPGGLAGGVLGPLLGAVGDEEADDQEPEDPEDDAPRADRAAAPPAPPAAAAAARAPAQDAIDRLVDRLALLDLRVDEGELVLHAPGSGKETLRLSGVDAVIAPGDLPGSMRFDVETHVTEAREHTTALRIAGSVDAHRRLTALDVSTSGRRLAQLLGELSPKIHVVPSSELSVAVHLDPTDPERPRLEGRVAAKDLGIDYWRIAHAPVTGLSFEVDFAGAYDRNKDTLTGTISKLRFGEAVLSAEATIERISAVPKLKLKVTMPKQSCAAVGRSIPRAMIPRLNGLTTTGSIWFDLKASIDLKDSYTFKLDLDGDLQSCAVLTLGGVDMDALNSRRYTHRVVVNGEDLGQSVGPGTKHFVRLKALPEYVGWAAIATEDLAFYDHEGFRLNLIKRAVKMDLDYKRYVYGGSTISQQLVKNLFLTREKTLSRKAEEAILTWYMEQRVEKERILELYLNCIEYGPEIWGIKRAAAHYFDKRPQDLTPLEAAFLMGLKPCPKCGYNQWKHGGLDARWQHRMDHILKRLRDRGWITEEQYEESKPFMPAFWYPDRGRVQLEAPRGSK